jgi:hypothetical protein
VRSKHNPALFSSVIGDVLTVFVVVAFRVLGKCGQSLPEISCVLVDI